MVCLLTKGFESSTDLIPISQFEYGRGKIEQGTLKPITKVDSKLGNELQEWEVESTKGGGDLNERIVVSFKDLISLS